MIIANKALLDDFVQTHAQSASPLNKWVETVKAAEWRSYEQQINNETRIQQG